MTFNKNPFYEIIRLSILFKDCSLDNFKSDKKEFQQINYSELSIFRKK